MSGFQFDAEKFKAATANLTAAQREKAIAALRAGSDRSSRRAADVQAGESVDKQQLEEILAHERAEWARANGTRLPHGGTRRGAQTLAKALQVKTTDSELLELQRASDRVVMLRAALDVLHAQGKPRVAIEKTPTWTEYEEVAKAIYSTGTGTGDEWVPTVFSNQVQERIDLETTIWQGLPEIQIPQGAESLTLPVTTSTRGSVYLQGQPITDNPAQYRVSTPGTDNLLIAPVTLASRNVVTQHMAEDSAAPVLDWMLNEMVVNFSRAYDDACVNGDTTATHQDSDVTDPTDHRKAWEGFREIAADISTTLDLSTAISTAEVNSLRKLMGVYGINPKDLRLGCSMSGYIALLNLAETQTVDKFGPNATVVTGELAKINGCPIIVSEFVRDNMNASGVYDGSTTTRTGFVMWNVRGFARATKRELRVQSQLDITTGVYNIVGTSRVNLIKTRKGSGEKTCSYGFNHTA